MAVDNEGLGRSCRRSRRSSGGCCGVIADAAGTGEVAEGVVSVSFELWVVARGRNRCGDGVVRLGLM